MQNAVGNLIIIKGSKNGSHYRNFTTLVMTKAMMMLAI